MLNQDLVQFVFPPEDDGGIVDFLDVSVHSRNKFLFGLNADTPEK